MATTKLINHSLIDANFQSYKLGVFLSEPDCVSFTNGASNSVLMPAKPDELAPLHSRATKLNHLVAFDEAHIYCFDRTGVRVLPSNQRVFSLLPEPDSTGAGLGLVVASGSPSLLV